MNKIEIEVPINVRYISDWLDFNVDLLKGHSIINKTITGCGFTSYSLTNSIPTILCSPRKFLLENKHEQLPNTYLVISDDSGLNIDGDFISIEKKLQNFEEHNILSDSLRSYIFNCQVSNIAPKILVTYDSLGHILSVLGETIKYYSIIVDEFQNIFMDASFKADTELNFVDILQSCPNVTYLSATPYIEEYLNELDEFKDLPYYELRWDNSRLHSININLRKTSRIADEIDKIIEDYRNKRFPEKVDSKGITYQSKEVVFYVNSVRMICSILKRNNLTQDEVNVICSRTEKNQLALNRLKSGILIGKAPLEGQPHKMFTFCTRTTYVGADFYSTNALSVIISDCKIDSLSTDIRMDFPQIMGRQRLKENVFRDECIFIFSLSDSSITMEEHEKIKNEKLEGSKKDLENYDLLKDKGHSERFLTDIRTRIKVYNYKGDYTGINSKEGKPVINKLVMLSERRAFELRSNVYKNEVQVYNEFLDSMTPITSEDMIERSNIFENLRQFYNSNGSFAEKMKAHCSVLLNPKWFGRIHASDFNWTSLNFRNYLNYLGADKIRALGYEEFSLKNEIRNKESKTDRFKFISSRFIIGEKYTMKEIKLILSEIYINLNISKTPKATDLLEIFETKEVNLIDKITSKRVKGYEILGLK